MLDLFRTNFFGNIQIFKNGFVSVENENGFDLNPDLTTSPIEKFPKFVFPKIPDHGSKFPSILFNVLFPYIFYDHGTMDSYYTWDRNLGFLMLSECLTTPGKNDFTGHPGFWDLNQNHDLRTNNVHI